MQISLFTVAPGDTVRAMGENMKFEMVMVVPPCVEPLEADEPPIEVVAVEEPPEEQAARARAAATMATAASRRVRW